MMYFAGFTLKRTKVNKALPIITSNTTVANNSNFVNNPIVRIAYAIAVTYIIPMPRPASSKTVLVLPVNFPKTDKPNINANTALMIVTPISYVLMNTKLEQYVHKRKAQISASLVR